jgi:hypothetical protein
MQPIISNKRPRPGDRLTQLVWLNALATGDKLPIPSVERVRVIKELVAAWELEDRD